MPERSSPWWTVAIVALLAAVAAHVAVVVHLEPFAFDAWNVAADTRDQPFSWSAWAAYLADQHAHGNPRLGQAFAYLGYKLTWVPIVLTPVAWLALVLAIVTLGLGRRPSLRAPTDIAVIALVLGVAWLALPYVGTIVFCRAYAANYLYTAAGQLWFLTAYRTPDAPWVKGARGWQIALFGLAGVAAGAGNQHTGPLLGLVTLGVPFLLHRRGERRPLLWAGAIGVIVGFAWLFFAPGNETHYDGLAGEAGLAQRALSRGVAHNAVILRDYLVHAAPQLAAIVGVLLARRDAGPAARRGIGLALGAGLVIAGTLFVSPKLGHRFFFLPLALLLAAVVQLVVAIEPGRRARLAMTAAGAAIAAYVAFATIPLYQRLHGSSERRLAELAAATPGAPVVVSPWEIVDLHWFFWGDDFKDPRKRRLVQDHLGTGPIVWSGPDRRAPLGLLGAGFVVELEPPGLDQADLQPTAWEVDLPLLARQLDAVVRQARVRAAGLTAATLRVRLPAPPAGLPGLPIAVARWTPGTGTLTFPTAAIFAGATGDRRTAAIPAGLEPARWYLWPIGLPVDALATSAGVVHMQLAPGRTHWLLACLPARCFVTAVVRHRA
jgi:hypothetical protein